MDDDLSDLLRKKTLEDIGITDDLETKSQDECDFFRELCHNKIDYDEPSETINNHEKFIAAVDKLNCQFPFLQYNKFIESFVSGYYVKLFISGFQLSSNNDFKKCHKEFNLDNKNRRKSAVITHRDFTKRENLQLMGQKYDEIINECKYFKNELEELYNYNFGMAVLLLYMLDEKINLNNLDEDIEKINFDDVLDFKESDIRGKCNIT